MSETIQTLELSKLLANRYASPLDVATFFDFCAQCHVEEVVEFLVHVSSFRNAREIGYLSKMRNLLETYINQGSEKELNISSSLRYNCSLACSTAEKRYMETNGLETDVSPFDNIASHLEEILQREVIPSFREACSNNENMLKNSERALWWRQETSWKEFFSFPHPINSLQLRVQYFLSIIDLAVLIALYEFSGYEWVFLIFLYGFAARVLCGPRLSPQAFLALFGLIPFIEDYLMVAQSEYCSGPPRRFAQGANLMMGILFVVLLYSGLINFAYSVIGVILFYLLLASVFDFDLWAELFLAMCLIPGIVSEETKEISCDQDFSTFTVKKRKSSNYRSHRKSKTDSNTMKSKTNSNTNTAWSKFSKYSTKSTKAAAQSNRLSMKAEDSPRNSQLPEAKTSRKAPGTPPQTFATLSELSLNPRISYAPSVGGSVAHRGASLKSPFYSPATVVIMGTRRQTTHSSSMSSTDSLGLKRPTSLAIENPQSMFKRPSKATSIQSERTPRRNMPSRTDEIDLKRYSLLPKNVENGDRNRIYPSHDPTIDTRRKQETQFERRSKATSVHSARTPSPRSSPSHQSHNRRLSYMPPTPPPRNAPTPIRIPGRAAMMSTRQSPGSPLAGNNRQAIPIKDRRLTAEVPISPRSPDRATSVTSARSKRSERSTRSNHSPISPDRPSGGFSIQVVRAGSIKYR